MGQITKEFAETLLKRTENGEHIKTTVWEERQLVASWLALHGHKTWPGMPAVWLPIEDAPKDGTPILVRTVHGDRFVAFYRPDWREWFTKPGLYRCEATHWTPLPAAPKCEGEQQQ